MEEVSAAEMAEDLQVGERRWGIGVRSESTGGRGGCGSNLFESIVYVCLFLFEIGVRICLHVW